MLDIPTVAMVCCHTQLVTVERQQTVMPTPPPTTTPAILAFTSDWVLRDTGRQLPSRQPCACIGLWWHQGTGYHADSPLALRCPWHSSFPPGFLECVQIQCPPVQLWTAAIETLLLPTLLPLTPSSSAHCERAQWDAPPWLWQDWHFLTKGTGRCWLQRKTKQTKPQQHVGYVQNGRSFQAPGPAPATAQLRHLQWVRGRHRSPCSLPLLSPQSPCPGWAELSPGAGWLLGYTWPLPSQPWGQPALTEYLEPSGHRCITPGKASGMTQSTSTNKGKHLPQKPLEQEFSDLTAHEVTWGAFNNHCAWP